MSQQPMVTESDAVRQASKRLSDQLEAAAICAAVFQWAGVERRSLERLREITGIEDLTAEDAVGIAEHYGDMAIDR